MDYKFFMEKAYEQACIALSKDETPIGAVIVYNNEIIAEGYNRRNCSKNSLYHAEIIAINKACKYIGDWRLENCSIFVTLEPCPMCSGAILQSRMKELIFASRSFKAGSAGSIVNLFANYSFNHRVEVVEGILEEKCSNIMSDYFKNLRKSKK